MGSGVWPVRCKKIGVKLRKVIVAELFKTRAEASAHEVSLIVSSSLNSFCKNISKAVQNPQSGPREYRSKWADFLDYGILECGHLATILYIELVGTAKAIGVSSRVLAAKAGCTITECNAALSMIAGIDKGPLPAIYPIGNTWKVMASK
jgi:hypothetical protein